MKIINRLFPALIVLALCAGCGTAGSSSEASTAISTDPVASEASQEELGGDWDEKSAVKITLNGASATVEGAGASVESGVVTITAAGTYAVSGKLDNGQIVVNATKNDAVQIVLNGADITNQSGAAIYAPQCNKLVVTLAEGTENRLTDGGSAFVYTNVADEEPDAALFAKDDLVLNGSGSLTVEAGFNNGIGTKDDLIVAGGSITVNAANHGLRGRDSVSVTGGSLNITAGKDGVQSNNDEDPEKGWVAIENGSVAIQSVNDGIQAETELRVQGGDITVTAGGGSDNKPETTADSDSFKGLKAGMGIAVSGGKITISSADDSVHSNGNITVSGGELNLATGDDGIHADGDLAIENGSIDVAKSFEALEAANITVSGGTIRAVADDDGLNAAGGSDGNTEGGQFGRDRFAVGDYSLNVSGGNLTVIAARDGFDSNGVIQISGGEMAVFSTNGQGGDGAMDSNGEITVTGGTLVWGGRSTGGNPGESSTQSYAYHAGTIKAGTLLELKKDGKTVASVTPEIDCQAIAFSAPEIKSGESYELYSGSDALATITAGTGGGMQMGGPGGGRGGRMQMPEDVDMEVMRQAMEILQSAQNGQLTEAQTQQLRDLGLTDEQIKQLTEMPQRGGGQGFGQGPGFGQNPGQAPPENNQAS